MAVTQDAVFEVDFECWNCGATWTREFPPQTVVRNLDHRDGMWVLDDNCTELLGQCDSCAAEECPTCELTEYVIAEDRRPLSEDEDGSS